ncbi:lanC-like protein 2 [Lineus longissimus]|uniref:lanC-like protein 2 n=1 Tax=Lineus longissimus TaxID=88925 RepID=UPI002B4C9EAA
MEVEDGRHFPNAFEDYKGEELLSSGGQIRDDFRKRLIENIERLLRALETSLSEGYDEGDYSIYTGSSGIALLHLHLYKVRDNCQDDRHLHSALGLLKRPLRHLKQKRVTFLCGDAGPLAVGAVIYSKLQKKAECEECLKRLLSLQDAVINDPNLPNEVLFGRVGYLFGLLFVRQHLGVEAVNSSILSKVFSTVIESGRHLSVSSDSPCPLMYEWHEKKYLGAAHGLVGIFYMLMQCPEEVYKNDLNDYVKPSIDWLMNLRFPSGNYPSSIGSSTGDKLVHWCHGAPGWIHMFVMAYKRFGDPKYLQCTKECADVLWTRGLLKKGYGICHGTAGNGYGLLAAYKLTNEPKYLFRAMKFAEFCCDYGSHNCRIADRPNSLFEGLAGTIYFLADVIDPRNSKFPAFEL